MESFQKRLAAFHEASRHLIGQPSEVEVWRSRTRWVTYAWMLKDTLYIRDMDELDRIAKSHDLTVTFKCLASDWGKTNMALVVEDNPEGNGRWQDSNGSVL